MAALADLSIVAVWVVAFALALLTLELAKAIVSAIDVSIAGFHPFHGIATKLHNAIVEPLEDAVSASSAGLAHAWASLKASFQLLAGLSILLGYGTLKALQYLWTHSLPALVVRLAQKEIARLKLPHVNADAITADVTRTVEAKLASDLAALRSSVAHAEHVAALAATTAASAVAKAEHAVTTTIEQVVTNPTTYIDRTVTEVVPGLVDALTAAGGEVADLPGLVLPDIESLLRSKELGTLAGLLAAIPLLRAITNTIAQESGLENAECRAKVKQICATDPSAWAQLLGGLAAIGIAFNLRELYAVARPLVDDLAAVIEQAA